MSENDPRTTPVIVGVGQVNDRPDDPTQGHTPADLMAEALRRADGDAGGGLLEDCDWLAVVRQIGARPAVKRGRIVNKAWGDEDTQLLARHSAADFEGKKL